MCIRDRNKTGNHYIATSIFEVVFLCQFSGGADVKKENTMMKERSKKEPEDDEEGKSP